jgi:hypothetical protein
VEGKTAGEKQEHQENYALAFQGQNRALIRDRLTEGFTPKKHANKQMRAKGVQKKPFRDCIP